MPRPSHLVSRFSLVVALFALQAGANGQTGQENPLLAALLVQAEEKPEQPVLTSRFTSSVSQWDDQWVGTLYGAVEVTEKVSMTVQLDTTGYISVGAGYGFALPSAFVEPYVDYGRSDFVDVYDMGVFGAYLLSSKTTLYGITAHQWRKTNTLPSGGFGLFDQNEWHTTVGFTYDFAEWANFDLSVRHGRLLQGNDGITAVENDNITSGSLALNFKSKYVQPFVRFTVGQHRVNPGDPVIADNSFEFGVRL